MHSEATEKVGWGGESTLTEMAARWHKLTLVAFLAWIGSFMGTTFLLGDEYFGVETAGASALVGLSVGLGVLAVYTYWRFLNSCDELQQRIQLNGLALGFGVGLVFMMGYRLAERVGATPLDVNDAVGLMAVCYALGVFLSSRRYR